MQMQIPVAHPGRVHGRQRPRLLRERGGEPAQRPVENSYALGVGPHEQRVLHIGGRTGGRRRLHHAAPPADGTEGRLPQGLPAPPPEGTEEPGGEEGRAEEGLRQPEAAVVSDLGGGSDVLLPLPALALALPALVRGGPLLGNGDASRVVISGPTAALLLLMVVARPGVVGDLLLDLLRHLRGLVGHLDEVAAAGVAGHLQDPAGPDETGLGELRTVGLRAVLVELVDLLVPPPVPEMPLGDLPEGVVMAALRRLDPVVLRVAAVGGAPALGGVRGVHGLLGQRGGGTGGGLFLLSQQTGGRLLRRGDGRPLVLLQLLSQLRESGREAGRGRADQQQSGDELPREQLARPGSGHPVRHPDAGHGGLHLHEYARGELGPGKPDENGQHIQKRAGRDLLPKPVQTRTPAGQRPPHLRGQRPGHPHQQNNQGNKGKECLDEIPERTPPSRQRLRRPIPRTRRTARRAGSGASRHGGCPDVVCGGRSAGVY